MKLQKSEVMDLVTLILMAVAGGYISTKALNWKKAADGVTPALSQTMRAGLQLLGGGLVALVVPGKGILKIIKVMGAGTAVVGGINVAENVLTLKMLAGPSKRLSPEMLAYIQSGGRPMNGPMPMRRMSGPMPMRQMNGNPAFMGGNPAFMGRGAAPIQFKASN